MNVQDLRVLLEQTDDKLSIFASSKTLNKYKITIKDLFDLQRKKFMKLCDICPNLQVVSILNESVEFV